MSPAPNKFTTAGSSIFAAVLAVGLIVSLLGFQVTRNLEEKTIFAAQQRAMELIAYELRDRIDLSSTILESIRGLFLASEKVSREEFEIFTQSYLEPHPELQALEWVPRIPLEDRADFERDVREMGLSNYQIKEQNNQGQLIPVKTRNQYFPVFYMQPWRGNESVLGFDLSSNQIRFGAITSAAEDGKVKATSAIPLVQDAQGNSQHALGVLIFLPVYKEQQPQNSSAADLRGVVVGVIRIDRLFQESLEGLTGLEGLDLALSDVTDPEKSTYLVGSSTFIAASQKWMASHPVEIVGRIWRITTHATKQYVDSRRTWLPDTVLITGFLLTTMLSFFLWSLVQREKQVRTEVEIRTSELKRSEKRLAVVLENAADAIIAIDGKGKILFFNPAAESIFGYGSEEVVGQNVKMLMPEPYRSEHDQYLENYQRTGKENIIGEGREVVGKRKDGSTLPIHLSVGDASSEEEKLYVGVLLDLTLRKAHEAALISAKEGAEQANRQKSTFLNMMSHELRTPLTVILGYLPVLQNEEQMPAPRMIADIAKDMSQSGNHLLELINDLLDISKIEAGQLSLKPASTDISESVQKVLAEFELMARKKGVDMETAVQKGQFILDPMRFRQILINLVGNALKFTEQGTIRVEGTIDGSTLKMSVKDSGVGIPASDLPDIFDAFKQVDSTRTRRQGGSGLGLAITKRLVELHNGIIQVESQQGQGTLFRFTIVMKE